MDGIFKFIKEFRVNHQSEFSKQVADTVATHFGLFTSLARFSLSSVGFLQQVLSTSFIERMTASVGKLAPGLIPTWNSFIPRPAPPIENPISKDLFLQSDVSTIVYFPTCVNRIFGNYHQDILHAKSLSQQAISLLHRAQYRVEIPPNVSQLCCGLAFASKGFPKSSEAKAAELEKQLIEASKGGKYPVFVDASPCMLHMKTVFPSAHSKKLHLIESIQLAQDFLLKKLQVQKPILEPICVHTPCSSKKMGLETAFQNLAKKCAMNVFDSQVPCCGMAGDRGLLYPELPKSSLKQLQTLIQSKGDRNKFQFELTALFFGSML